MQEMSESGDESIFGCRIQFDVDGQDIMVVYIRVNN